MADRVLPSRDEIQHSNLDIAEPAYSIVAAYLDDELKTEGEWRETIDYEAINQAVGEWAARELGEDWIGAAHDIVEMVWREAFDDPIEAF